MFAVAALALLALAPLGPGAVAQAESTWGQYQGGAGHAGALEDGPGPPFRTRWILPAPAGDALSAPIVVGEEAVAAGSEAVYGIDLATGKERLIAERSGGPLSSPAFANVGSTPAILFLEGTSASGDSSGQTGTATPSPTGVAPSPADGAEPQEASGSSLVAVSLEDGTELWRAALPGTSRSGVTVEGGSAYVGDQVGNVHALALQDGSEIWTADAPGRVDTPVAVSGGMAFAIARDPDAGRSTIVALNASTGEESWSFFPPTTSTIGSAPSVGEGFVVVGSGDRLVRSMAVGDGKELWASLALSFFSPVTSPALAGGSVYAADISGGLYRFDVADGRRVWGHQLNEVVVRSAPVVSGDTVLLGLNDGRLVAIDSDSGHLVWESPATPGLVGTIALAPEVVVAVKGGRDAGLIAFEHDPNGTLLDRPSPTQLRIGTTLSRYGLAAAVVLLVALVPGMLLGRRLGLAELRGYEDEGEEGPE